MLCELCAHILCIYFFLMLKQYLPGVYGFIKENKKGWRCGTQVLLHITELMQHKLDLLSLLLEG